MREKNILEVKDLSVSFLAAKGEIEAVKNVTFDLRKGEILAIAGESGCGKSVLCKAIMKLLPENAFLKSGRIKINGEDITDFCRKQMDKLRGKAFSMIFQDPMSSLDPTYPVGDQIAEAVMAHSPQTSINEARQRAVGLMEMAGIGRPEDRYFMYPYELSGGMRQRIVIAIAMAQKPLMIFADEPTTSLDVTVQSDILDLFSRIKNETGTSVVFISHDLSAAAGIADRVIVMKDGQITETGTADDIYFRPEHPYTAELIRYASGIGAESEKRITGDTLLDVRGLTLSFRLGRSSSVKAVDDLSFNIREGEIFGLAGESGSGKSTAARCIMGIYGPDRGEVYFDGVNITDPAATRQQKKLLRTSIQMVFQDPAASLNERMKIKDIITEPLKINHMKPAADSLREEAQNLLEDVGLNRSLADRYPAELSGGMRQRVAIARALSTRPRLIIADEPVSSLDAPVRTQIIELFRKLRKERGFSLLFIAHDLSLIRNFCDRTGVMFRGKMVEMAETENLFSDPRHPYTISLLSAIPAPDPVKERAKRKR